MIIAIKWYRGKKLFVTLDRYNTMSKKREFQITCYHKKVGKRNIEIGHLEYSLRESKKGIPHVLNIDNMDVYQNYQMKGYGRIILGFAQGIAQASGLKITLFSLNGVLGFYRKCGFYSACKGSQDMIWFPKKRKKNDK